MSTPFQGWPRFAADPGRCPGLACLGSLARRRRAGGPSAESWRKSLLHSALAVTNRRGHVNHTAPQSPRNRLRHAQTGGIARRLKYLLSTLLAGALVFTSRAEDGKMVRLSVHKDDIRGALEFYEKLTGKPVFIALDLHALVTIEPTDTISVEAAIALIRKILLERYGIELRTTEKGETLAAWSKDPKYPRHSDDPETDAERNARPKGHIRAIPSSDK